MAAAVGSGEGGGNDGADLQVFCGTDVDVKEGAVGREGCNLELKEKKKEDLRKEKYHQKLHIAKPS